MPTQPVMPAELADIITLHRRMFGGWTMQADTSNDDAPAPAEAGTATPAPQADTAPQADAPEDATDWKAQARKWEARAKENSAAAAKLAKLEEAGKTELQKATDRATAAEKTATTWQNRYQQLLTRQAIYDHAQAAGAIDTEAVHALLRDTITVNDEGQPKDVAQAVKELKARKPHLFRATPGAHDAATSSTAPALNAPELEQALRRAVGA